MRILFFGDVVGRSGQRALEKFLPSLKQKFSPDFIVVNAENAAAGFGVTNAICRDLFRMGIDVLTTGNHIWDQKGTCQLINNEARLLRPINFPLDSPGQGYGIFQASNGKRLLVINAMGRVFMNPPLDCPFRAVDDCLKRYPLNVSVDAIIIDIHAEANSEKQAMGYFCDGRASLVVGTHTHVPTADLRIQDAGTAFQTDVGMCGDYNSIQGMQPAESLYRFLHARRNQRYTPSEGNGSVCGVFIETDDKTGLAKTVERIAFGGTFSDKRITNLSC